MMRRKVWWASIIVVALLLCFFESAGWAQCEMCKTALMSSPEGKNLVAGFRRGILLLLIIPYLLIGAIGALIFNAHRRRLRPSLHSRQNNPLVPTNRGI